MPATLLRTITRSAYKATAARLRTMGLGKVYPEWDRRAIICERCPLRVVEKKVSYCGRPLLQKVDRDPAIDGCGCPTISKAKDPDEHCPVTAYYAMADHTTTPCNCRWCASAAQSA